MAGYDELLIGNGGRDLFVVLDPTLMDTSGIPPHMLEQSAGGPIVLRFDADNNPKRNVAFTADGMMVDLSFDTLYPGCLLPWDAFVQLGVRGDAVLDLNEDDEPVLPGQPYPEDAEPVIWKDARVFHEDDGEVPPGWKIVTDVASDGSFLIIPMDAVPDLGLV